MLAELLKRLEKIEGLHWIRILYTYPEGITKELINNGLIDNAVVITGKDTLLHIKEKDGNNLREFEKMEEF